jgi:hypothetical protein
VPLLDDAIAAAGGAERWEQIEALTVHVRSGGLLLATRARRGALRGSRRHSDADVRERVGAAIPCWRIAAQPQFSR